MISIKDQRFFSSWSGGKDSCLALYHAIQNGGIPAALFTMLEEGGKRSRSHGLPVEVIRQQAKALGIPLTVGKASWERYEEVFSSALRDFKQHDIGCGVFGDIDLEPHLEWVENTCSAVSVKPFEPLWKRSRRELLEELFQLGFTATIVAVKLEALDRDFLGRQLDRQVVSEMEKAGIDASGEEGEYHTVVTDGPLMSFPVEIKTSGQYEQSGYCFLDIEAIPTQEK